MKLFFLGLGLIAGLTACGSPEPVATGYKKQLSTVASSTPAPATSENGTPVAATANLVNGQTIYTANCAGCHQPLATSAKLGRTAAQVEASLSATPSHASLTAKWPKAQNAIDVAAALKRP